MKVQNIEDALEKVEDKYILEADPMKEAAANAVVLGKKRTIKAFVLIAAAALILAAVFIPLVVMWSRTPGEEPATETTNETKTTNETEMTNASEPTETTEETLVTQTTKEEADYTQGLVFAINPDGASYTLVGPGSAAGEVIRIPESYNGLPVTEISPLFKGLISDKCIVYIPDSIKVITQEQLEMIGEENYIEYENALYAGNPGNPYVVLVRALDKEIEEITIRKGTRIIADGAFEGCEKLKSVIIPDSVVTVGGGSFKGCSSLERAEFGKSVELIGSWTFSKCTALREVVLPEKLKTISSEAFEECPSLHFKEEPEGSYFGSADNQHFVFFKANENAEEITLHKDTKIFACGACRSCTKLKKAVLNEGIVCIEYEAFRDCTQLEEVVLPETLEKIGPATFYGCSSLRTLILPDNLKVIEDDFNGCEKLGEKDGNINYLGSPGNPHKALFRAADKHAPEYAIHEDTEIIVPYSMKSCTKASRLTIPDKVRTIGDFAFSGGSFVEIHVGKSVVSIGDSAFSGCEKMRTISLPAGLQHLGSSVFSGCKVIRKIELPDGVETVPAMAFFGCSQLFDVRLPANVTQIGVGAFKNSGVKNVTYGGSPAFWKMIVVGEDNEPLKSANLFFRSADPDETETTNGQIPEGEPVDGLLWEYTDGGVMITGCAEEPVDVAVPASVNGKKVFRIEDNAFEGKSTLKTIVLPEGIESIGDRAFYGCSSLERIELPASLREIGEMSFFLTTPTPDGDGANPVSVYYGGTLAQWLDVTMHDGSSSPCCSGGVFYLNGEPLENVVIPESVTAIKDNTFLGCSSIVSVKLHEGVVSLGDQAFRECRSLVRAELPKHLDRIGIQVFMDCSSLHDVVLPETVGKMSSGVFINCTSLEHIVMPESVDELYGVMFENCTSLKSAVLPNNMRKLPIRFFSYCGALNHITLPARLSIIESSALRGCAALETIDFGGTERQWKKIEIDPRDNPLDGVQILFHGALPEQIAADALSEIPGVPSFERVRVNDFDSFDYSPYNDAQIKEIKSEFSAVVDDTLSFALVYERDGVKRKAFCSMPVDFSEAPRYLIICLFDSLPDQSISEKWAACYSYLTDCTILAIEHRDFDPETGSAEARDADYQNIKFWVERLPYLTFARTNGVYLYGETLGSIDVCKALCDLNETVMGAAVVSGVFDLTAAYNNDDSLRDAIVRRTGGTPDTAPEEYESLSAINFVPQIGRRFTIISISNDSDSLLRQSSDLAVAIEASENNALYSYVTCEQEENLFGIRINANMRMVASSLWMEY